MTLTVVFVVLLVLLVVGLPVAFAMLVAGSLGLYLIGGMPVLAGILKTSPLSTANSYELITIPMFILMAEFVILAGVANDLFRAASIWFGRVRGGVAMATAVAGAGFGAISGSSAAAAATLSSTSLPALLKQGYEPKLAGGVVAISGTLAMLIPPSIALILYGVIADVSVRKLLIAGLIPGLLVTAAIMLTVAFLIWRKPERAPVSNSYTFREKFSALRVVWPMLLLFFAVTGSIYVGIATPTEASGLGAFSAMLLALKEGKLNLSTLAHATRRSAQTTCMILLIILSAHVVGYFFALTQLTHNLVGFVGALDVAPLVIIAIILLGYLVLGCFMEQTAIMILTVPVVLPVVVSLGFDPIWFGIIVVITAEVGMVTPPVGINLFVVSRYTGLSISELFEGVLPHIWAHLAIIVLFTLLPGIILWLPSKI